MARVYKRKFDWEEARRLRAEGLFPREIAKRFGVSPQAVYRVVTPGQLEKQNARLRELTKGGGVCDLCGGPMNRQSRYRGSRHCVPCAIKLRTTSVRETELLCFRCREWKADKDFPRSRTVRGRTRRERASYCRACQTIARQEYRNRNKVPCAAGCGKLVIAPRERETLARSSGRNRASGMCRSCANRATAERRRLGLVD